MKKSPGFFFKAAASLARPAFSAFLRLIRPDPDAIQGFLVGREGIEDNGPEAQAFDFQGVGFRAGTPVDRPGLNVERPRWRDCGRGLGRSGFGFGLRGAVLASAEAGIDPVFAAGWVSAGATSAGLAFASAFVSVIAAAMSAAETDGAAVFGAAGIVFTGADVRVSARRAASAASPEARSPPPGYRDRK
jgi:hypothetical protein